MSRPRLFAVTGKPVYHSRSPQIFNSLFHEMGIDGIYTRFAAANTEEAIKIAKALKLAGLNVTSPYKEETRTMVLRYPPDTRKKRKTKDRAYRPTRVRRLRPNT